MSADWQAIESFSDTISADLLLQRLAAEGIDARIVSDSAILGVARRCEVRVPLHQKHRAQQLLALFADGAGHFEESEVALRAPEAEDAPGLFAAVRESIAEVSPWLPWCHAAYQQSETQAFIAHAIQARASRTQYAFLATDAHGGEILGGVGINHIDYTNRLASLGYWVRTSRTGQSVALRAARLAADFAFRELGMVRLEIVALPENRASRRVAEKLGAVFECIARNRIVMHGKAYDAALYALLPDASQEGKPR